MTRKRWFILAGAAIFAACSLWYSYLLMSRSSVTRTNYNRLKAYMTTQEVQAVFGGWPYWTEGTAGGGKREHWVGYDGSVHLTYDEHGKLVWRQWEDLPRRKRFPESFFGSLQWPAD